MKCFQRGEIEMDVSHICLFCGQRERSHTNVDNERWYECDCPDAVEDRELLEQISRLQSRRPKHKFYRYQEWTIGEIEDRL